MARDPSERLETPKRWRTLPDVLTVDEVYAAARRAHARRSARLSRSRDARAGLRRRPARLRVDRPRRAGRCSRTSWSASSARAARSASCRSAGRRSARSPRTCASCVRGWRKGAGKGVLFLNARGEPLSRMGAWKICAKYVEQRGDHQARLAAHPASLVRDASARGRRRPSRRPGNARPRGHLDDADLHPRGPRVLRRCTGSIIRAASV